MKLLIADDDDIMRNQLKDKIPWKDHGFDVVGIASDGREAYQMALRCYPQILLTDIKMPYLSGIELVEEVQKVIPDCRAMFLTGYDDFAFAKEAIRLRAEDYILKGEDSEVILKAVKTVAERVKETRNQAHLNELGQYLQKQNYLSGLLQGNGTLEEMKKNMKYLGFDPEHFQYRVAVLKADIGRNPGDDRKPSRELQYIQKLADSVKYFFNRQNISAYYMMNQQYLVMVLEMEEASEESIFPLFKSMAEEMAEKNVQKITIGIGRTYEPGNAFSLYYDDAVFANENASVEGEVIHFYQELSQTRYIRLIREYILEHYANPQLSLLSLSEKLYLSPAYISSLFKRYMDDNFKTYLIKLRLKKACQLLKTTNDCSYEVAYKVGYPNSQYFSVMFRKYMNMTPSEYRAMTQEK